VQQLKFFDTFLHDKDTGRSKQPKVFLQIRHPGEKFIDGAENEWPRKRTKWTKCYLDPTGMTLAPKKPTRGTKLSFNELTSRGPFLHGNPHDRPPAIFDNRTTLYFSRAKMPYLLLPTIPPKRQASAKKPARSAGVNAAGALQIVTTVLSAARTVGGAHF